MFAFRPPAEPIDPSDTVDTRAILPAAPRRWCIRKLARLPNRPRRAIVPWSRSLSPRHLASGDLLLRAFTDRAPGRDFAVPTSRDLRPPLTRRSAADKAISRFADPTARRARYPRRQQSPAGFDQAAGQISCDGRLLLTGGDTMISRLRHLRRPHCADGAHVDVTARLRWRDRSRPRPRALYHSRTSVSAHPRTSGMSQAMRGVVNCVM